MKKCPICNSTTIFTRTYNVTFKRAYNTSKIYEPIRIPKYVCAKCLREFDVEKEYEYGKIAIR